MSQKRKDNKGRILRDNEYQKADGRYEYRYVDIQGERRSAYSWRLVITDKTPAGKKDFPPLRDLEKTILLALEDGVGLDAKKMTVLELVERYVKTKTGVAVNTETGYQTVINLLKRVPFGNRIIGSVRVSEAKLFLIDLQKEHKKSFNTVASIRGVLRPAFAMAVEDNMIRKNPFGWELATVLVDDSHTREAITRDQYRKFMKFIQEDEYFKQYYDAIFILFGTGMRISEFCGLTMSDLDLKARTVRIDHQIQRTRKGELYVIDKNKLKASTKTKAGVRTIPVEAEVFAAFKRILKSRPFTPVEPIIDGYSGFLILNDRARNGIRPMVAMDWEHIFKRIVKKYNSIYRVQMPSITPHVCRHTYCSFKAKSGMNPKILQFLMGHSDISVTLNTYTHLGLLDAMDELERLKESRAVVNSGD